MSTTTPTDRYAERIRERVPRIRERIRRAAERSGRDPHGVRLIAVSKGHPMAAVEAGLEEGLEDLAENRISELEDRVDRFGREAVRWHMVGHVQRRKAPRLLGLCDLLHSLDSHRLAERLDRVAEREGIRVPVLVQLNTSGEASKGGFEPDGVVDDIGRILELAALEVRGLMTMAPLTDDETILRDTFRGVREAHEAARAQLPQYGGRELSMGMTNDYELAVEEGSTMVRLGTAVFGERPT